jgi:hypothetical protein
MNPRPWIFLLVLAFLPAGAAVSLMRDTIDTRQANVGSGPTVIFNPAIRFVPNPGTDSLRVDSITMRAVKIGSMAQLTFRLERIKPGISASSSERSFLAQSYQGGGSSFFESTRFTVGPRDTARLAEAGFDMCIYCPVAKRAATQAQGDTLKAWVMFHSGGQKDSVLFLSVERMPSALAPWFAPSPVSTEFRFYDPLGRAVERRRVTLPALPASRR